MQNTLEIIGERVRGFAAKSLDPRAVVRRLNFMPSVSSGSASGGGGAYGVSLSGGASGDWAYRYGVGSTGSSIDMGNGVGDVLSNSVVAACVNAIVQALPEAPILLERRGVAGEYERVGSHPILDLLHNPNPYLSEAELWGITTSYERTRGEAFWYFEYGPESSVPREIWFRAPEYVQTISDGSRFISGYNITAESGGVVALDESDVVHFRHQLSTSNPRAGWSPIQTGRRQIVGDNSAAAYHSAILRNAGAASLIISLKDAAAAGEVTPGQLQEYVDQFKRKVSGEGAGAILGLDLPLDVHKVGFSPDEMALEKILEYYESRICALMGVNHRVINLGSDPTYENSKVALNDFWERTIVPMRRRHASTLSSQLLPLFGLDSAQYRLRFDFSEVEALRENLDALHARWRETFAAGGIDLFTFQEKIGLKPDEATRDRFVKASSPFDEGGDEIKNRDGYDPNQPRDRDGKWTSGAGIVLSSKPMSGGDAVALLHREHGKPRAKREIRARSGSLSHAELEELKPHLPKFLADMMASSSTQYPKVDAMESYEIPMDDVKRIRGRLATEKQLAEAGESLKKMGVEFLVDSPQAALVLSTRRMVGGFSSKPPSVMLRANPTIYELAHECFHAAHWHKVGPDEYENTTRFEREEIVYQRLEKMFDSGIFNEEEIDHAKWYINYVKNKAESHIRPDG